MLQSDRVQDKTLVTSTTHGCCCCPPPTVFLFMCLVRADDVCPGACSSAVLPPAPGPDLHPDGGAVVVVVVAVEVAVAVAGVDTTAPAAVVAAAAAAAAPSAGIADGAAAGLPPQAMVIAALMIAVSTVGSADTGTLTTASTIDGDDPATVVAHSVPTAAQAVNPQRRKPTRVMHARFS